MNTDGSLLFKDEVFQIVGGGFEVLNGVGHGLQEKLCENALTVELTLKGVPYRQQRIVL